MPNRVIKESICTSDNIDRLTFFEECVFVRLLVNCDDFGRFDARPKILSSKLFPLKSVSPEEMQAAINSLVSADLITVYEVDGKPYLHMNTWERHQRKRANNSKYPAPSVNCQTNDGHMSDNCCQTLSNASEKRETRNENRETRNDIIEKRDEGFIDDEDARQIQTEQNRIFDAAEDAGFKVSNSVRANLLRLYADYGLDKMLAGFESCVKHGAANLAYLEACLKGSGQRKPSGRVLPAQDFEQRDYSDVPRQDMQRLAKELEEFNLQEQAEA